MKSKSEMKRVNVLQGKPMNEGVYDKITVDSISLEYLRGLLTGLRDRHKDSPIDHSALDIAVQMLNGWAGK